MVFLAPPVTKVKMATLDSLVYKVHLVMEVVQELMACLELMESLVTMVPPVIWVLLVKMVI